MGKHLAVKFPVLASTAGNALSKQSVEPRGEARGKEQDNGGRWAEAEVVCTAQFGRVAVPCRLCYCMNAVRTSGCAAWSEGFFCGNCGDCSRGTGGDHGWELRLVGAECCAEGCAVSDSWALQLCSACRCCVGWFLAPSCREGLHYPQLWEAVL